MQDPEVILADEPVASLDPGLAESIATLLVKLADERRPQRTLIVTLHTVELALRHFPRVVGVNAGRIAFDVPVAEVSRDALDILYAGSEAQTKEGQPLHAEPWREPQCAR
jgi:phosphonate transport system ATP-binding protein